jgi:hypothetical protein
MVLVTEQTIVIAEVIERYIRTRPRAADKLKHVRQWWVALERSGDSLDEVQIALEYLVDCGRLKRSTNVDGTIVYSSPDRSNEH